MLELPFPHALLCEQTFLILLHPLAQVVEQVVQQHVREMAEVDFRMQEPKLFRILDMITR